MIELFAKARLPTRYGLFEIFTFKGDGNDDNAVLVRGDEKELSGAENVPTRIHSECLTGDVFTSKRCDCRQQLEQSMEYLGKQEIGILIYLRQEGRGIGLLNKIKAYSLQEQGYDTVEANVKLGLPIDNRDYDFAKDVITFFGIKSIALMSNNPSKFKYLEEHGIKIQSRIPIVVEATPFDRVYLDTKREKLGHQI